MKALENERQERRDWIIIVLILLLGLLCILLTSGWALRFAPSWRLPANMRSNLDPNSDFLTQRPSGFFEPLDPAILTKPVWDNFFLTPGAIFPTRTPIPTLVNTLPAIATKTFIPTPTTIPPSATNTLVFVVPTNTSIYIPPSTATAKPTASNTPIPTTADLQITKTDGSATYTAGNAISYTIVISNAGPLNATGASVADTIPAAITGTTINCVASGTASCGTNASAGNNLSYTNANIPVGAGNFLTITVNGTVASATTGNLVNTAMVTAGAQADPTLVNNTATDTDTPNPQTNLAVTKDDGSLTYTPGNAISYSIVVSNAGPSNAIGASVADTIPAAITGTTINCVASGTATCGTNASAGNNLSYTGVNIPVGAGNFLTITASGTVNLATTGNLVNTVTVTAGAGQTDPTPGNNSATDTDTQFIPSADLQITKTDGIVTYTANLSIPYTLVVSNPAGPSNVIGATVSDTFSTNLTGVTWTCSTAFAGASCTANGIGDINDTAVNLPVGASVTYIVSATAIATPIGDLVNTASVTVPAGITDSNLLNNTATDTDTLIEPIPPEIGPNADGTDYILTAGACLTMPYTITVNGHASWDLVYYERAAGSGILLDWVILYIGDGSTWHQVFNWGDNIADTNTNMDFNFLPPPAVAPFPPPEEPDQRDIPTASLYTDPISGLSTGVAIDLDIPSIPPGTYPYLRVCAPPGDVDGQTEIDAIQVLP